MTTTGLPAEVKDGVALDPDAAQLTGSLNIADGRVVHPAVAAALPEVTAA